MTPITLNTPANNASTLLSMPSMSDFSKEVSTNNNFINYTMVPETAMRKSATRLSSIDWDLNMNELEFE